MNRCLAPFLFVCCCFLFSCSVTQHYSPTKKYSKQYLQEDYLLLKGILESKHPSLYWYTSRDSMDYFFSKYYWAINDSMTESQFAWQVLVPLVDKIHCGHTSVALSNAYYKWAEHRRFPSFPLYFKVWNDTMAVTANLDVKDSIFKRGTLVTSINGVPNTKLISKMFEYLPEDGYANNINYIRLSANFPYFHRNIYGLSKKYAVTYIDSTGNTKSDSLSVFIPHKDSARKDSLDKIARKKMPKLKKIEQYRSFEIDSSGRFAVMTLNSFSNGRLRGFFRRSFRTLKKQHIENLVLDIRSNGGGRVGLSTLLTKYVTRKPFRVADTLFARSKTLAPYTNYIKGKYINNLLMFFMVTKKNDGLYHIRHLEKKYYHPKHSNAFKGSLYVLTNGPTFSASSLFCNAVKGQPGILLAGEETGGGWYGNDGILIPDIILPRTKMRVRLPLFRLVQYNHVSVKGTGVIPDLYIPTSYEALLKSYDKKMQVVRSLILEKDSIK